MLRRAKRPSELRDSWRLPEIDHQRGRGLRMLRRWSSVAVVTLLGVAYFYLLLSPFWHPHTHFATLSSVSYDAWQVRPLEFAQEDAAAVQQPLNSALLPKGRKPAVALHVLRTPADVTRLTDSLAQLASTQSDVLILYLAAHGVAWDGEPYLLCQNFDPANAEAGRFPVATLLRQLAESSAGVKLLLLDAGRIDYEPRLGLVANDFPDLLVSTVERAGDSRLWVLSSHASMQRAHVDPARRTSAFGAAVAQGLDGAADRSGDRLLDLRELADYVRGEVAANVRRATGRLQTPQLIWGGGRDSDSQSSPLLLAVQSSLIPKQLTGAASKAATKASQQAAADPKVAGASRASGQAASLANSTTKNAENSAAGKAGGSSPESTKSAAQSDSRDNVASAATRSAASGANDSGSARPSGSSGNAAAESDESLEQLLARAWRMSLPQSSSSLIGSQTTALAGVVASGPKTSGGTTARGSGGLAVDGGVASGASNAADSPADGPGEATRRVPDDDGRSGVSSAGRAVALPTQFEGRAYFWRAWLHRLWAYEKLAQTGDEVVRGDIAAALRRDLTALESSGELPAGFRVDPSVAGLRAPLSSFLPSPADSPTWSLAHRIATERAAPLPAAIARWTTAVEQRITDAKPDAWKKLVAEEWPDRATGYFENRFLRELTTLPPRAWSLTQLAWQTCRAGQRVATHRLAPALASRLDEADRWQWVARREMTDQIGDEWITRAETCLQQSLGLYLALERDLEELAGALRLRQHWLLRAPEYVRWHQACEGDVEAGPQTADLRRFLRQLHEFVKGTERIDTADLPRLLDQRDRLNALQDRLEAAWSEPALQRLLVGSPPPYARRRVALMLDTWLPPATVRARLLEAAARWDASVAGDEDDERSGLGETARTAPGEGELQVAQQAARLRAVAQLELELALVRLGQLGDDDDRATLDEFEAAWVQSVVASGLDDPAQATSIEPQQFWKAQHEIGRRLREYYQDRPTRIAAATREALDHRDGARRAGQVATLRAAQRAMTLADPRDLVRMVDGELASALQRAEDYDLLALQIRRAELALENSTVDEARQWSELSRDFRRLAEAVPQEPPLGPPPGLRLLWDGPTSLSLAGQRQREESWTITWQGTSAARAWLVADYDPDVFEVVGPPGVPVYFAATLRQQLQQFASTEGGRAGRAPGDLPLRPDLADQPAPTWELPPSEPVKFSLKVRRRGSPTARARVVLSIVADGSSLRRSLDVDLPALDSLQIVAAGPSDSWTPALDGLVLHPQADQQGDFPLSLVNNGLTTRKLEVRCFAPERKVGGESAEDFLAVPVADMLNELSSAPLLFQKNIELPPGGTPVAFGPAGGEESQGGASAGKPAAAKSAPVKARKPSGGAKSSSGGGGSGGAADDDGPPPRSVRQGLIVALRDLDTNIVQLRRIRFQPPRPRQYLDCVALYDAAQQRLEVRCRARDRSRTPPDGYQVKLEFNRPLTKGIEAQLEGAVTAPEHEARLYARIPREDGLEHLIAVHVDGYPRAMLFRVPCWYTNQVGEADDIVAVRIVNPKSGKSLSSPQVEVPVDLEVDAPLGAFEERRDFIEIGLDRNRDRELRGDPTLRIFSDRQADIELLDWTGAGLLSVTARVSDLKLALPAAGLQNIRSNVLAKVQVGAKVSWSDPVEVRFDGAPPVLRSVDIRPSRVAPIGGELTVVVDTPDEELSGVGKIEVGFDVESKGEFSGEPPVVAQATEQGRWTAKVPVSVKDPGTYTLLVRATDKVGNEGEYSKFSIGVISKEAHEAKEKASGRPVAGRVTFGPSPLVDAVVKVSDPKTKKVIAETKTNDQGGYEFASIPAGKHKVNVRGVAKNRPRLAERDLDVPTGAGPAVRFDVEIK